MSAFIELLGPALAVTVLLVAIHTLFGLQVLRRNVVFIDLALAQMAALGATVAFTLGHAPLSTSSYAYSFGFTLVAAMMLSGLRFLPTRIPHEALIGILYIVAAAATLLFIDKAPQGAEHLKQLLTGNIVTVTYNDVTRLVPLYLGISVLIGAITLRHGFTQTGLLGWFCDLLFYAGFGAVVTSSVSVAGVLLVFSFLIIPACIGILLAESALWRWLTGIVFGSLAGGLGLFLSFSADLPAGATIVCCFGGMLGIIGLGRFAVSVCTAGTASRYLRYLATVIACILLVSAAWILVAPRSDQPLLNTLENGLPAVSRLYQSDEERQMIIESFNYAERYRHEAERLNQMESNDRASGNLDDAKIAKIASFIKSYNEMRKGEQFVIQETIARARERSRLRLFAMQFGLALFMLWPFYRRITTRHFKRQSHYHVPSGYGYQTKGF
jgi:zinc/manganese transport system permease protein